MSPDQIAALQVALQAAQAKYSVSGGKLGQMLGDLSKFISDAQGNLQEIKFSNAPDGTDSDDASPLRTIAYDWQKVEKLFDLPTLASLIKQARLDLDQLEDAQEKLTAAA